MIWIRALGNMLLNIPPTGRAYGLIRSIEMQEEYERAEKTTHPPLMKQHWLSPRDES